MQLQAFVSLMEEIAPTRLAESWDNVGLLIGTPQEEIERVLVALDPTQEAAMEAVKRRAQVLLTHHPLMLGGVTRLQPGEAAYTLVRHNIALYSAHTNLDIAKGGVNDVLAALLELEDAVPLEAHPEDPEIGMGRVGNIRPCTLGELAAKTARALNTPVQLCGDAGRVISRMAVCGGSGGSFIGHAAKAGAQAFVSGDFKHHQALDALCQGLSLIDATHAATEMPVVEKLISYLQGVHNGLQYNLNCYGYKSQPWHSPSV